MEQVPTELAGVDAEQVDVMLQEMLEEVQDTYYEGVKLSMVEYVLKSSAEAKRVEITRPPQKFETKIFHPSQDWSVAECAAPKSADSLALGAWHDSVLNGFESVERDLAINHDGPCAPGRQSLCRQHPPLHHTPDAHSPVSTPLCISSHSRSLSTYPSG